MSLSQDLFFQLNGHTINHAKKDDFMTLTKLIPENLMRFYINLKCSREVPNEIIVEEHIVEDFYRFIKILCIVKNDSKTLKHLLCTIELKKCVTYLVRI